MEEDLGRAALAATRAALDPARGAWQCDILISVIVEILARRGPLTERELISEQRSSWVTAEIHTPRMLEAISEAERNDLIQRQERQGAETTFAVTQAAARDAESDQEWARRLQNRFARDVEQRLIAELDTSFSASQLAARAPLLAQMLMRAMVEATADLFRAARDSTSDGAHEVRVNLRAAVPGLKENIEPEALGEAVGSLLLAAANPSDTFGNDMLETISRGQLLHGMLCRRDVPSDALTASGSLIVDTSELLNFVHPDANVRELFLEFLRVATRLGSHITISSQVHEEWKYQWEDADRQLAVDGPERPGVGIEQFVRNPTLRAYFAHREKAPDARWADWSKNRRRLPWHFSQSKVSYTVSNPPTDLDDRLIEELKAGLRTPDASGSRPRKSDRLAHTDAVSAAWVHSLRIRRTGYPEVTPDSWFIAQDRHTRRLYSSLRPDDHYPVAITSSTWLLRYASIFANSKEAQAKLVERIAAAAVMDSFVSVVSAFTTRDVTEIQELLASGAEEADIQDAIRSAFWDSPHDTAGDNVAQYSRRRSRRRDQRASREVELAAAREQELKVQLRREQDRVREAEAGRERTVVTVSDKDAQITRLRRTIGVLCVGLAVVIGLLVSALAGPFDWRIDAVIAGLVAMVCLPLSVRYIRRTEESAWTIVVEVVALGVGLGVPYFIDAWPIR